jgi:hypothetical protein
MPPSCTQKRTRAILPRGKLLLISHKASPIERTSGMPTGHENSTSFYVLAEHFAFVRLKPFQPFRTGSRPPSEQ